MHGGKGTFRRKCFPFLFSIRIGVKHGHMWNELKRFREREIWKRKPVFIKCRKQAKKIKTFTLGGKDGRRKEMRTAMTKQLRQCGDSDPGDYGSRWLPDTCGVDGDASG